YKRWREIMRGVCSTDLKRRKRAAATNAAYFNGGFMKRRNVRTVLLIVAGALSGIFVVSAQTPPEPGLTPGVVLTNISKNTPKFASVFPQVAVSRSNPNLVAVAWRQYNLPIDTNALKEDRIAECHVSISKDGGSNFTDKNMMSVLRTPGGNGDP